MFGLKYYLMAVPAVVLLFSFFYYGKKQYNLGYLECQNNYHSISADIEKEVFSDYKGLLENKSKWENEALLMEEKIRRLDKVPFYEVKKYAKDSPCDNVGDDVVRLLNSFQEET